MRLSCTSFVAWSCRNKRGKFIIGIFLLVVCFLLWQSPQSEELGLDPSRPHTQDPPTKFLRNTKPLSQNDVFSIRQQNVIKECEKTFGASWRSTVSTLPVFKASPIISVKHNLMYCPVGKVASSFFTRLVLAMNKSGPMTSPLRIPIEQAGRERCDNLKMIGSKAKMADFLRQSTKIVFGRNPFSRIYSAYIDKLFSPNPFYWTYWGEKALKLSKATKAGKPCASDVTFQQFIRLVLFDLHRNDVHLRQVYDECHMCDIVYDVTGTLETVKADLDNLLDRLNVSSSFQHEASYTLASKMDIVYDAVQSTFSWKKDISRCISSDQMGLRIWRKLQIRGVLDSSMRYPFRPGEMDNLLSSAFINACKKAILMSTDHEKLKKQKRQALVEAYKTVSYHDLVAIGNVYKDDFRMFGYNSTPSDIFYERVQMTGSLNWRNDWIL